MAEDTGGADHLVVVQERLAHAHEHDAAHRPIGLGPDGEDLPDDLGCIQVAAKPELTGGAKSAGQGAARLRGDADDVLLLLAFIGAHVGARGLAGNRNADGFDACGAVQLEEILHEAVGRRLSRGNLEELGGAPGLDALDQLAPDAAHRAQIGLASLHGGSEHLAPDLLGGAEQCVVGREKSGPVHGPELLPSVI